MSVIKVNFIAALRIFIRGGSGREGTAQVDGGPQALGPGPVLGSSLL